MEEFPSANASIAFCSIGPEFSSVASRPSMGGEAMQVVYELPEGRRRMRVSLASLLKGNSINPWWRADYRRSCSETQTTHTGAQTVCVGQRERTHHNRWWSLACGRGVEQNSV